MVLIDMTDLHRLDLNLLTAFEALMIERNVTLAARRFGVGQPAMSYSLARLRDWFGDPLFIRTADAMQPTLRALELAEPIARILGEIRETLLADREFRPATQDRLFRIGASDQAEVAMLPPVLAELRKAAPSSRLTVTHVDRDSVSAMLESGAIDLALGFFPERAGAEKSEILFREEFVCLFDPLACGAVAPISLATYLELPHLLMSLRPELTGAIDASLARKGHRRFVLMSTPHFLAIPFLLRGLRAVAAVPTRLAQNWTKIGGLAMSPLPVEIDGYDVSMLWHARTDNDPAQAFIRGLFRKVAEPSEGKSRKSGGSKRKRTRSV